MSILTAKQKTVLRCVYQFQALRDKVRPIEVKTALSETATLSMVDYTIKMLVSKGYLARRKLSHSKIYLSCTEKGAVEAAQIKPLKIGDGTNNVRCKYRDVSMVPKDMPGLAGRSKPFGLIVSDKVYARIMAGVDYSRDNVNPRDADGHVPARGLAHSGCSSSLDGGA